MERINCPSEEMLARYVEALLTQDERAGLERHIADCPRCVEALANSAHPRLNLTYVPNSLKARAKQIAPGIGVTKNTKWLLLALFSFALSFIIRRYFLQFLVACALFGGKWIVESRSIRTLIMLRDAYRRQDKDRLDQLLKR